MTEKELDDIERSLARLAPKAIPAGLRQRIMDSALESRKNASLTPWMKWAAVTCAVLIVFVLIADPLIGRFEAVRMAALINAGSATDEGGMARREASDLAELAGIQGTEAAKLIRLQARITSAVREERRRRFGEAMKGLRGWLEYETSENIN
ncbi:MAG: hypothetical protein NT147_02380 [Candidatus Aminicenantes bacterium]|nr:hypothetical protein [Candidatus Aminicenantes bacterium]